MNGLNSILIEGKVDKDGVVYEENEKFCSFVLESQRVENKKITTFGILVTARGNLATNCNEKFNLSKFSKVRVVGRLANEYDDMINIIAEHVEFKPKTENKSGDDPIL